MKNNSSKLDKLMKVGLIMSIALIIFLLCYYSLIKPKQEEKLYADCLSALKSAGKIDNDTNSSDIKIKIEMCVKSNGAKKIILDNQEKIACIKNANESYEEDNSQLEQEINQAFKERDAIGSQVEKDLEFYKKHETEKTSGKVDAIRAKYDEVTRNINRIEEEFKKNKTDLILNKNDCKKRY
jgi:hypothetical protein